MQTKKIFSNFSLQQSGDLLVFDDEVSIHPPNGYCIYDCLINSSQAEPKYVLLCRRHECWWKFFVLDPILLSVSSAFLAVSLIAYVSVAELRKKRSNCSLMCLMSAQLLAFTSTLAVRFLRGRLSDVSCRLLVLLNTFGILASFAWLNVVCYEVWTCVPLIRARTPGRTKRRWWLHSVYGWGIPVAWTTLAGAVDVFLSKDHALHPNFVRSRCYFKDTLTTWAYRNGPVLLMLLVNLYFFVRLVVTLAWRFRDIDSGLQTARRSKDRYKLFIRLFIVMGLSWCLEFLTHSDTCAAWLVLCELVVELQGLWIFFVTVYSKNNRTLVLRSCSNSLARFGLAREWENRQGITATGRNSNSTSENSKVRTSVLRMTGSAKSPDVPGMPSISRNVDIPIAKTLSDPTTSEVQENSDQTSAVTRISEAEKAARVKDTSEAE